MFDCSDITDSELLPDWQRFTHIISQNHILPSSQTQFNLHDYHFWRIYFTPGSSGILNFQVKKFHTMNEFTIESVGVFTFCTLLYV